MVPTQILEQVPSKCSEGLALGLASDEDGASLVLHWCNRAFSRITGYSAQDAIGQRGTILIGPDTTQGAHLLIIDKLMKWEHFTLRTTTNRKDGTAIDIRMTWTPLSDPETGARWWLCSMFEIPKDNAAPPQDTGEIQTRLFAQGTRDAQLVAHHSEEILRLERENKRLRDLAKTVARESNEDALTGLSNRRHFEVELKTWISALRGDRTEFAVIYIDLDRFKSVNDTLGHDAGDGLLVSVARTLRRLSGPGDMIARLGGDEFVILKRLGETALNISGLADDIVRETQLPFAFEGKTISCSASVGVAIADTQMSCPEQIVADADTALYHAKSRGRGRWSFFTAQMHAESIATKRLATELLVACERQEFVPYFQPLVETATGRISSAETLVRWAHPVRGLMPPAAFLDVAADMGILNRIDAIVFSRLREELSRLDTAGVLLPRVAINVSAGRLADPNLIHDIKSSGIDPERLTVEILESVYLERMGASMRWALDELDELGVTVAVDDFGTGHASVQGLLKIKPALLKIDRQFIQPIVNDKAARALVESIIGIGKSLGMRIVAEGVETARHAEIAGEMGCDHLQGYHFGKPMSAKDLQDRLRENGGLFWPRPAARQGGPRAAGV